MTVLHRSQAQAIHGAALQILEEIGVRMEHDEAREILGRAGCRGGDGPWVRIPAAALERALESAPRVVALHNQRGGPAMALKGENTYFGTGSDTLFTLDLRTGVRRRTVLADTAAFARLVDALPNLSFAMSMANPVDVPVRDVYVAAFAEMVRNTDKPLVFVAESRDEIERIRRIAALVAGGDEALRQKPFLLCYNEAISPLRFPAVVMDKLLYCARAGFALPRGPAHRRAVPGLPLPAAPARPLALRRVGRVGSPGALQPRRARDPGASAWPGQAGRIGSQDRRDGAVVAARSYAEPRARSAAPRPQPAVAK